jgi:protein phosphatase
VEVDLGGLSHQGKVRHNNEDCFLTVRFERGLHPLLTNLPADSLPARLSEGGHGLLVADGIGGMAAGEVASHLAVSTLVDLVMSTPDWIMRLDEHSRQRVLLRFAQRYHEIDTVLCERARAEPDLAGMGTTLTVAGSIGTELIVTHVGDSRAYLYRDDRLQQLTRDHTFAQALADLGTIAPEEVATHPRRHILTRALGGGPGGWGEPDLQRLTLQEGDGVLLCTDGLTEMVDDAGIAAILRGGGTSQEICQALVDAALDRGGKDNVTVVLARYHFPEEA